MADSRKRWEEGLSEELRDHIERQTTAMESVKEDCRDERRGRWFEALWADVRYGLRD
jgi:hypothetical protein